MGEFISAAVLSEVVTMMTNGVIITRDAVPRNTITTTVFHLSCFIGHSPYPISDSEAWLPYLKLSMVNVMVTTNRNTAIAEAYPI